MNFFFSCCKSEQQKEVYQVRSKEGNHDIKIKYFPTLEKLKDNDWKEATQIMKIKKSEYQELISQYKNKSQKWTDQTFRPNQTSIGDIPNVNVKCQWKRIPEFVNNPVLFSGGVDPTDIVGSGNTKQCCFLSALASLAEKQDRIYNCLGDQKQINKNGIYKVQLRVNGIIQQIIVDDYIPVDYNNKPFFSQPNGNQCWVLIVQKAWAKCKGSYQNIITSSITDVFRALACAPAQTFMMKDNKQSRQKAWKYLDQYTKKDFPCVALTKDEELDWKQSGLTKDHSYTIICATVLQDTKHQAHRMLKLRNSWLKQQWKGRGNQNDKRFWNEILEDENKKRFFKNIPAGEDGIFFMQFEDFCNYFQQIHFCLLEDKPMYQVEYLSQNGKNGNIYMFQVKKQNSYVIEIHQSLTKKNQQKHKDKFQSCRSTILLAKGKDYQFIDGVLKYNQFDTQLRAYLDPGKYFVYCKFQPTKHNSMPEQTSLSTYSTSFVDIKIVDKNHFPNFFKKVFLAYARQNKKKEFNNQQMWVSYKLMFDKGGFAYIAFGNQITSDKKFVIKFDEKDFNDMNYSLKRPHKGKGKQQMEILPGQEQVIVARVKNGTIRQMRFPPPFDINIEQHKK